MSNVQIDFNLLNDDIFVFSMHSTAKFKIGTANNCSYMRNHSRNVDEPGNTHDAVFGRQTHKQMSMRESKYVNTAKDKTSLFVGWWKTIFDDDLKYEKISQIL